MKKILLGLLIIAGFSKCGREKCDYNECSRVAPASEIAAVQNYLTSNNITATQHCSGLFYTINNGGSGKRPNFCQRVTVNYVGKLTNGNEFDRAPSSRNGNQPAVFNLDGVVAGFRNGIPQIKTGGTITLYVPPSLGYGSQAQQGIPANSILIFTVDLLDVQ